MLLTPTPPQLTMLAIIQQRLTARAKAYDLKPGDTTEYNGRGEAKNHLGDIINMNFQPIKQHLN